MRWPWIVFLLVALSLFGCADRKMALVGKWQLSIEGGKSDDIMRGMAKAVLESFELDLMKSGQASITVTGRQEFGKWTLDGEKVTIDILGSAIKGRVDRTNDIIRVDEFQGPVKAPDGMTLILKKKQAP